MVAALAIGAPGCSSRADAPVATSVGSAAETGHASIDPGYAADIGAICDALHRSNADRLSVSARTVTVAMWLGDNLKTAEARAFLVRTQPLVGDAKAAALETEQAKVGLPACPLAVAWRAAAATPTGGASLP